MIKKLFRTEEKSMGIDVAVEEVEKALEEEFGKPIEPNIEYGGGIKRGKTAAIQKSMDMVNSEKPAVPMTPTKFAEMSIENMKKIKAREGQRVAEKAIIIQKLKDEIVIHEKMIKSCNSFLETMDKKDQPATKRTRPVRKKVEKTPAPEMGPLVTNTPRAGEAPGARDRSKK